MGATRAIGGGAGAMGLTGAIGATLAMGGGALGRGATLGTGVALAMPAIVATTRGKG